jgi:hypothetical protein
LARNNLKKVNYLGDGCGSILLPPLVNMVLRSFGLVRPIGVIGGNCKLFPQELEFLLAADCTLIKHKVYILFTYVQWEWAFLAPTPARDVVTPTPTNHTSLPLTYSGNRPYLPPPLETLSPPPHPTTLRKMYRADNYRTNFNQICRILPLNFFNLSQIIRPGFLFLPRPC